MRKCVHLFVDPRYPASMLEFTVPSIERYARKIGAVLNPITRRMFPDYPATYEKMQIFQEGRGYDWNACISACILAGPALEDFSACADPEKVAGCVVFNADYMFEVKENRYFVRNGRDVAIVDDIIAASSMTHDLWQPLEGPFSLYRNLFKRQNPEAISTYCLAQNIARYALKLGAMFRGTPQFLSLQPFGQTEKRIIEKAESALREWGADSFRERCYVFMDKINEFIANDATPAPRNKYDPPPEPGAEGALRSVVQRIISEYNIEEIIETGTYDGRGSSRVLASTGRPFTTIECNPESCRAARCNLRIFPNALVMHALSLPLEAMMRFLKEDSAAECRAGRDLAVIQDWQKVQLEEISQLAPRENVFLPLINNDKVQLILLDSGAAGSFLEFLELMNLDRGRLGRKVLILNNADHVKHRRTIRELQSRGIAVNAAGRLAWCAFGDCVRAGGQAI